MQFRDLLLFFILHEIMGASLGRRATSVADTHSTISLLSGWRFSAQFNWWWRVSLDWTHFRAEENWWSIKESVCGLFLEPHLGAHFRGPAFHCCSLSSSHFVPRHCKRHTERVIAWYIINILLITSLPRRVLVPKMGLLERDEAVESTIIKFLILTHTFMPDCRLVTVSLRHSPLTVKSQSCLKITLSVASLCVPPAGSPED